MARAWTHVTVMDPPENERQAPSAGHELSIPQQSIAVALPNKRPRTLARWVESSTPTDELSGRIPTRDLGEAETRG